MKKAYKSTEEDRQKFRQEKMIREKNRRDALQRQAAEEKDRLSKVHLITSMDELKGTLSEIDEESISVVKKGRKKRALLREQINIRKKVFKEAINIPFTTKGKQRPLSENSRPIWSAKGLLVWLIVHIATHQNHLLGKWCFIGLKLITKRDGSQDSLSVITFKLTYMKSPMMEKKNTVFLTCWKTYLMVT